MELMHGVMQVFEESFHRCLAASPSIFDVHARDSGNLEFLDLNLKQQIQSVEELLEDQRLISPQRTRQTDFLVLQANKCRRPFNFWKRYAHNQNTKRRVFKSWSMNTHLNLCAAKLRKLSRAKCMRERLLQWKLAATYQRTQRRLAMRMEEGLSLFYPCIRRWHIRMSWTKWRTTCQRFQRLIAFAIAMTAVIQKVQFRRCFGAWSLFAGSPVPGYENVPAASLRVRQMRRHNSLYRALISLRACARYQRARRSQQRYFLARWRLVVRRRLYMRQWAAGPTVDSETVDSASFPSCRNRLPDLLPRRTWAERTLLSHVFHCWLSKVARRYEVARLTRLHQHSCLRQAWSGWLQAAHARKRDRRCSCERTLLQHACRARRCLQCRRVRLALGRWRHVARCRSFRRRLGGCGWRLRQRAQVKKVFGLWKEHTRLSIRERRAWKYLNARRLCRAVATWRRVHTTRRDHRQLARIAIGFHRRRLLSRVWHEGWRTLVLQRRTAQLLAGYMAEDRRTKATVFRLWLWGVDPTPISSIEAQRATQPLQSVALAVGARAKPLGCKLVLRRWRDAVVRIRAHRHALRILKRRRKESVLVACVRAWRRLQVTRSAGLSRALRRKSMAMQELRHKFKHTRVAEMFWRRRRLRKGLATLHAAARMRQSLKGTFARQRLRLTRQAFWKWQLCVFVHGGVHTPVWEVLGGRRVASRPSRRSYARRHLSKLRQAVNAEDNPAAKCQLLQDPPALPSWNTSTRLTTPEVTRRRPQSEMVPAPLPRSQSPFVRRRHSPDLYVPKSASSPLRFHEPTTSKSDAQRLYASTPSSASKSVSVQSPAADDTPQTTSSKLLFTPKRSSKRASAQLFTPNGSPKGTSTQLNIPDRSSKRTPSQTTSKVRVGTRTNRKVTKRLDLIVSPAVRTQCQAILHLHEQQISAVFSACCSSGRAKFAVGSPQQHTASSASGGSQERMSVDRFFRALLSVHASRTWLRGNRRFVVRALRVGVNASKNAQKDVASPTRQRVEITERAHERELTLTAFKDVLCLMASLCSLQRTGARAVSGKTSKTGAMRPQAAVDLQNLITRLDLEAIARAAEKRRAQQTSQSKSRHRRMVSGTERPRNATPPSHLVSNRVHKTDASTHKINVRNENIAVNHNGNDGKQSVSVMRTLSAIDEIIRRSGVWDMVVQSNRDSKDVL